MVDTACRGQAAAGWGITSYTVFANEKVGRAPARSLPFRRAAVGGRAGGREDGRDKYVCKSCRLAVTREDRRRHHRHRHRRDGLIGSFNPSGHLAESARQPPAPPAPPPPVVIIPIYLFILTRPVYIYVCTTASMPPVRRPSHMRLANVSPRCDATTSIGRRFFSSMTHPRHPNPFVLLFVSAFLSIRHNPT